MVVWMVVRMVVDWAAQKDENSVEEMAVKRV